MELLKQISENKNLKFFDLHLEKEFFVTDLVLNIPSDGDQRKKLSFLYLDNSVLSVAVYLSSLGSNYAMVLLSDALEESLKASLETEYKPDLIFDRSRNAIKGYDLQERSNEHFSTNFFVNFNVPYPIDNQCKVLLSTSGTTGSPKFVKLSETNLLENARSIAGYLPIDKDEVAPLNLPLHYSYGLSVLNSNAIAGGTIVCSVPDVLQREFWQYLDKYNFTTLAGVPYVYEMLNRIGFVRKNYPSLKYITQAGGNLSKNIKEIFLKFCKENGMEFYVMYGQTEATARISFVPPARLGEKITSIGIPIPNGQLSLDQDSGEILYEGPNIFGGYAERAQDLAQWENIGLLKTGDLGFTDEDGYFYIKGRLKRFVKIYGNRINLDEIERQIKVQLEESMIACIGINDEFILISHCIENLDEQGLKQFLYDRFKIHHRSIKIQQLIEIPLSKNGKTDYKKLKSDFLGVSEV